MICSDHQLLWNPVNAAAEYASFAGVMAAAALTGVILIVSLNWPPAKTAASRTVPAANFEEAGRLTPLPLLLRGFIVLLIASLMYAELSGESPQTYAFLAQIPAGMVLASGALLLIAGLMDILEGVVDTEFHPQHRDPILLSASVALIFVGLSIGSYIWKSEGIDWKCRLDSFWWAGPMIVSFIAFWILTETSLAARLQKYKPLASRVVLIIVAANVLLFGLFVDFTKRLTQPIVLTIGFALIFCLLLVSWVPLLPPPRAKSKN